MEKNHQWTIFKAMLQFEDYATKGNEQGGNITYKKSKRKEKQARKTLTLLTIAGKLTERKLVKQQWANFIVAWSSSAVRKA